MISISQLDEKVDSIRLDMKLQNEFVDFVFSNILTEDQLADPDIGVISGFLANKDVRGYDTQSTQYILDRLEAILYRAKQNV